MTSSAQDRTLAYHARTKHNLGRYARSPGYLDWATQPDPFRTYEGAPSIPLPLLADGLDTPYADIHRPGRAPVRPLDRAAVALLFELSLGLSAWKEHRGARWALRCNPSSGNLHPTEGYAIVPALPDLPAGAYHYVSRDHALERRASLGDEAAARLAAILPAGSLLVGLSSIHWREAWKYGERAFRYCQHDIGHAIAAVCFAAAALGLSVRLLDGLGDADIAAVLGLDREGDAAEISGLDREHPDALLLVCPGNVDADAAAQDVHARAEDIVALFRAASWSGRPNALSPMHVRWGVIDEVAEATWGERRGSPSAPVPRELPPLAPTGGAQTAAAVVRARRSAVAFDGQTSMDAATLYAMLDRLLPRPGVPPWDALPWAPHVHLALFVHRVRGLAPGLYAFVRREEARAPLAAAMHPEMLWSRPDGCPEHLPFYLLGEGDFRETAQIVSCHQEIAADGAFSLGMLAEFEPPIGARGPSFYRRLFWEAGALGQVLYLEAEAAEDEGGKLRATGIGCYFDDLTHEVLGLAGTAVQSLYHFTIGGPVEDRRIATQPPYAHLPAERRGDR
ncbi:nitroreductase family protein [Polyangium aurulentum]|uniref:nitroreductase family protein n=1 Tax=Polyangium aurulentum TaxID=2567896 RepID=UPI0010AE6103|nr:nitroreductase family protein [Polyangium aurulentum]UQA59725.1 nitroreductase family protein [Polyangium aurulentum]